MQPTPPTPRQRLENALTGGFLLVVLVYTFYSAHTQTGVGGWLIAWQLRTWGTAYDYVTVGLPLLAALLLVLALARWWRGPAPAGQPLLPVPPVLQPNPAGLTPRGLLWLTLAPLLLAVPAFAWFSWQDHLNESRRLYTLDLLAQPAAPVPAEAKYVTLGGVVQAQHQYILQEMRGRQVSKTERYLPLTDSAWRPGQPVRFFLRTTADAYLDTLAQRTLSFDQPAPFRGSFDGELSRGGLPTAAAQALADDGARAAEPYYVLEALPPFRGQVPAALGAPAWLVLVLGGVFSLMFLVGGGIGLLWRRWRGRP